MTTKLQQQQHDSKQYVPYNTCPPWYDDDEEDCDVWSFSNGKLISKTEKPIRNGKPSLKPG